MLAPLLKAEGWLLPRRSIPGQKERRDLILSGGQVLEIPGATNQCKSKMPTR